MTNLLASDIQPTNSSRFRVDFHSPFLSGRSKLASRRAVYLSSYNAARLAADARSPLAAGTLRDVSGPAGKEWLIFKAQAELFGVLADGMFLEKVLWIPCFGQ